ncbi:MAG: Mrp/NBP35 family ATP-binding protein [Anaerolineales bacterium]|nr:Mrp/NBP35 family ATP-binding protein [Anaerolineales bacterium]
MNTKLLLPGIKHILVIASGKGGVGKTTVTVNLALALQRSGASVGIFDADIYGPNVPRMLGVRRYKESEAFVPVLRRVHAPAYIQPLTRFGLKVMSVGLLVAEQQVINPPASAAGQLVVQTLKDVVWGELDYLLVDLPPSAGQPQEDLLRLVQLSGAVIVTTPQDLSLLDAGRSLQLFRDAGVPILGVVENMSYFVCPGCGERHEIFQRSQQWRPPALADVPVIGRVPLLPEISQGINRADPLMHQQPENVQGEAFMAITAVLREQLSINSS